MNFKDIIVTDDLTKEIKKRENVYEFCTCEKNNIEALKENGWEYYRTLNKSYKIKRKVSKDIIFRNKLWCLFAKMSFTTMSKYDDFSLRQIVAEEIIDYDIFAADGEIAILTKIFEPNSEKQNKKLSEVIEDIKDTKARTYNTIKKLMGSTYTPIIIIACSGYRITKEDKEKMKNVGIYYFDDDIVNYYSELQNHLGKAARFQLLGNLLQGKTIKNLDERIPAISGKMGKNIYYSFSIEPEKLLKIGYVLHQNNGNKDEMPAYQRLIKKSRLKQIKEFVDNGGFFPNSIIINILTDRNNIRFDKSNMQVENSISSIGVLHLPQKYRSAYIIDGQHRLYGYSDSKYCNSNSIPVVAFVNLDKSEQIKLFMEINENQKSVNKNLRNTLQADLLRENLDLNKQRAAISSKIAQRLGEDEDSPLNNNIIIGENKKNGLCVITIDTIKTAILSSGYLNTYRKNNILQKGILEKDSLDKTYEILYQFLKHTLTIIKLDLLTEWNKGENDNGYVLINNSIGAYIRILADILNYVILNENINVCDINFDNLMNRVTPYINVITKYLISLPKEKRLELKKTYGGGGVNKYWRKLQNSIHVEYNSFNPNGLEKYLRDNDKMFNEKSYAMIRDIELFMKDDFRNKLQNAYGSSWQEKGLPQKVFMDINNLMNQKNYNNDEKVAAWDCLHLINYRDILFHKNNWTNIFDKTYAQPGIKGNKEKTTQWLIDLNELRNKADHSYSIKEDEYNIINTIHSWLIKEPIL